MDSGDFSKLMLLRFPVDVEEARNRSIVASTGIISGTASSYDLEGLVLLNRPIYAFSS